MYIYIHIFGKYQFYCMTLRLFVTSHPVYHVYVFVFSGGKICFNKEGRV